MTLVEKAIEARRLGMSYGQYEAMNYNPTSEQKDKKRNQRLKRKCQRFYDEDILKQAEHTKKLVSKRELKCVRCDKSDMITLAGLNPNGKRKVRCGNCGKYFTPIIATKR